MTERELRAQAVTLLAWVFIILAALMTLIGAAQNILLHWLYPQFLTDLTTNLYNAPPVARFMAAHLEWLIGLFTLLSATLFVAAIGVLHRHDWARKLFIGLLIVGLVWKITNLVLMIFFIADLPLARTTAFNSEAEVETFQTIMISFNALLTIGLAVALIWISRYLSLPKVTVEFGSLASVEDVATYTPREPKRG